MAYMSRSSDKVKRWRINSKNRIIEAMGGKCCICGYNKCTAALVFHHLDPKEKELGLGGIRANPRSWETIVKELRKCIMLCHNCHVEVHHNDAAIPLNAASFNEDFATYQTIKR